MRGVVSVAIPKSEAVRALAAEHQDEFKCIERKIDEEIRFGYVGREVRIPLDNFPTEKVRKALEDVYKEAGWVLSFSNHQTEGPSAILR